MAPKLAVARNYHMVIHVLSAALRMPRRPLNATMAAIFVFCCPICDFTTSTLIQWFSHLQSAHSNDPSFRVTCRIDGCKRTYSKFSSLNSHVYRNHKERMCGSNSGHSQSERHNVTQSDLSSDLVSHDFQVGEPELLEDPFLLMGSENDTACRAIDKQ